MPFRKFRILDTREGAIIPNFILTDGDGALYITEGGMLTEIALDESLAVQYETGMPDANGNPIYQRDTLRTPNGREVLVEWDERDARWAVFANEAGRFVKVGPLPGYAKEGVIVRKEAER